MKKISIMLLILFTAIIVIYKKNLITNSNNSYSSIHADSVEESYGTYENAKNIIKEVIGTYYLRGPYLQYNYPRATYGTEPPENATKQDIRYLVCASFTTSVYKEAFGMSGFPLYGDSVTSTAKKYYEKYNTCRKCNDEANEEACGQITTDKINCSDYSLDGHFLIYYDNTGNQSLEENEKVKYIYDPEEEKNESFENFVRLLRPGDIFGYDHVFIVYDIVVNPSTGKLDALLLNSTQEPYIKTRISGTSKLSYNFFKSLKQNDRNNKNEDTDGYNYAIDIPGEGTIKYTWLSTSNSFTDGESIRCNGHNQCHVIRLFHEDDNGNAVFNYQIDKEKYAKSLLRVNKFPSIFIEKIVNIGDKNNVHLGNRLTYTVEITNKNNLINNGKNSKGYSNFAVSEELGEYVNYVSSTHNGSFSNNVITWNIDSLAPGEKVTLEYTVEVKKNYDNLNKEVISTGKVYDTSDTNYYITTGEVNNLIVSKTSDYSQDYKRCYTEKIRNKSYSGLELIDQIYSCATGQNFNFKDNFDFNNIIETAPSLTSKSKTNAIKLKPNNFYTKMILNKYWGGIRLYNISKDVVAINPDSSNIDLSDDFLYISEDDEINVETESSTKGSGNFLEYHIPRWGGEYSDETVRAKTINAIDFKDGDILIYEYNPIEKDSDKEYKEANYTFEDGIYAYIYITDNGVGKFVGYNPSTKDNINNSRDEFTYEYYASGLTLGSQELTLDDLYTGMNARSNGYYFSGLNSYYAVEKNKYLQFINYQTLFGKDNYVILRPELIMEEKDSISIISLPNKVNYNINDELDLTGLQLQLNYNTGKTEGLSLNQVNISGFNSTSSGTKTVTISYNNLNVSFNVDVVSNNNNNNNESLANIIQKNNYTINGNYVFGFSVGDSIQSIKSKLGNDVIIETNKDIIVTGAIIKKDKESYTVVIKGDANKDGKIGALDYILIRNHMLKTRIIADNDVEFIAADMNSDGKISALDYVAIRKIMMNE